MNSCLKQHDSWKWDWPLSVDGADCSTDGEKFLVTFKFQALPNTHVEITHYNSLMEKTFSSIVGLCPIDNPMEAFCRLEIEVVPEMNMIVIDAFREMFRQTVSGRMATKIHKIYRIPREVDLHTLKATMENGTGQVTLEAKMR